MFDIDKKVKEYALKNRDKCYALADWKNLKNKSFSFKELLSFICKEANGSFEEMNNIINHLTQKRKVYGRTQVYNGDSIDVDILRNENGELELHGYNPKAALNPKGQHRPQNNRIFRKDDQVNKLYQNAEKKMFDFGKRVKDLYPNEDNHFITFAMQAIKKYAEEHKIGADKVVNGIEKGRYKIDTDIWRVVPKRKDESIVRHTIIINEDAMRRLENEFNMTEYKFYSNIKRFISQLLQDPVNAQPPIIFKVYGYNRSILLKELLDSGILIKSEKISDRDENNLPKTATMMVKFRCPKKNFDRKLEKLYMRLFEKNLPPRKSRKFEESFELNEDGEGGAMGGATSADSSGQFIQPFGDVQRRKMPVEIDETTATTNTGDYQYTVPFIGDKETLARKNGEGGSVSINKM